MPSKKTPGRSAQKHSKASSSSPRPSSREVRIKVPTFFVVYFSRGDLPTKNMVFREPSQPKKGFWGTLPAKEETVFRAASWTSSLALTSRLIALESRFELSAAFTRISSKILYKAGT